MDEQEKAKNLKLPIVSESFVKQVESSKDLNKTVGKFNIATWTKGAVNTII